MEPTAPLKDMLLTRISEVCATLSISDDKSLTIQQAVDATLRQWANDYSEDSYTEEEMLQDLFLWATASVYNYDSDDNDLDSFDW